MLLLLRLKNLFLYRKYLTVFLVIILIITMLTGFYCQKTKIPENEVFNEDFSSIDGVIQTLYFSITFSAGSEPDLSLLSNCFTTDALFIRITQDTVLRMNRESFISSFRHRVESGQLTSFYEAEIKRKSLTWGSMTQVFSSYQKAVNMEQPSEFIRGINSMQLFYDKDRWWITSIIWEEETEERLLPVEFR